MAGRPKVEARCAVAAGDAALWQALQALGDPVRLRIIQMVRQREQCVCHLTEALGLSQGTVSHHMSVLKRAGLVQDRRDARWTYYRLAPVATVKLLTALQEALDVTRVDLTPVNCCDCE